jgi:hypothetical protein
LVNSCASTERDTNTLGEDGIVTMLIYKFHHLGHIFVVSFSFFSVFDRNLDGQTIGEAGVIGFDFDFPYTFFKYGDRSIISHDIKDRCLDAIVKGQVLISLKHDTNNPDINETE